MELLHGVQVIAMLLGGLLLFVSAYLCRRAVRPSWNKSRWKPIWKMRDDLPDDGYWILVASIVLIGISGVAALIRVVL